MLSLQSLPLMPLLIQDRGFMKLEASERLYRESAHVLSTMCVTVPLSLTGAGCQILIIFTFTAFHSDYVLPLAGWLLLLAIFFDALLSFVSAVAAEAQQAQTLAAPFVAGLTLFNGLLMTRATAPVFLRWLFSISPTFYALQSILMDLAEGAGTEAEDHMRSLGYCRGEDVQGVIVISCMIVVLRALQVVALTRLNHVRSRPRPSKTACKILGQP